MKTIVLLGLAGSLLVSTPVLAEEAAPPSNPTENREAVVDKREEVQQNRIDEGVKSGQLTEREAKRLEHQQGRVEKMEANAMKDGKMSKREFRRIDRAQNHTSRSIERKKHNRRHK